MKFVLLFASILITPAAVQATTFAQVALGGGYECTLIVSNKSSFSWEGKLYLKQGMERRWSGAWRANGSDFTGQEGGRFSLRPKETMKIVLTGDATTRSGYIEIFGDGSSSSIDLAVSFFYNYYAGGQLVNTTGSPASVFDTKFILPVERSPTVDTGFAWAPFIITTPFRVNVTLYSETGALFQTKTLTFDGHSARFFSQVFDGVPVRFVGAMLIESENMITLTALRLEQSPMGFLLTSVQPDDYVP